ncbi:hypothetical protein M405DRAFT_214647 [Rhizopogon salebrosus TDB-379]|nr:hypothetical protein M405DRAFT_214647 [Rhizopogon salebrosus TDB-379]
MSLAPVGMSLCCGTSMVTRIFIIRFHWNGFQANMCPAVSDGMIVFLLCPRRDYAASGFPPKQTRRSVMVALIIITDQILSSNAAKFETSTPTTILLHLIAQALITPIFRRALSPVSHEAFVLSQLSLSFRRRLLCQAVIGAKSLSKAAKSEYIFKNW